MLSCNTVKQLKKIILTRQGNLFVKIWQPQQTELSKQIPILLFHDSLGCVQLWHDFPEQLCTETHRMIIAYDRHGFGQSDASDVQLSTDFIQQEALVAAKLLDQLGISQVIALGHSVGGGMAVSFASQYPFKCVAVITEATQAYIEQKTLDAISDAKQIFQQPAKLQKLKKYHAEKAQWVLDAWTETWLSPAFRNWTLDNDLKALQTKFLVIHGHNDEYGSLAQPERLAKYADAELHLIEACGHVPHREKPQLIVQIIKEFVAIYA
ncbi:MAG: alpha/beta hydrolase [Acinetobacter sp. 38-8]|nr:MAG: alpha/beta hydrolase [Acinetobacter sp. 38-8]